MRGKRVDEGGRKWAVRESATNRKGPKRGKIGHQKKGDKGGKAYSRALEARQSVVELRKRNEGGGGHREEKCDVPKHRFANYATTEGKARGEKTKKSQKNWMQGRPDRKRRGGEKICMKCSRGKVGGTSVAKLPEDMSASGGGCYESPEG